MRAKAYAARQAIIKEITTEPTVRMVLLAKRIKNFSPEKAVTKLSRIGTVGNPHFVGYIGLFILESRNYHKIDWKKG